jgi:hypothetical protein
MKVTDKYNVESVLQDMKALFPTPLLRSEDRSAYYQIMEELVKARKPQDFIEKMLVKDMTNAEWYGNRYCRHKALTIEHKLGQLLEFQNERERQDAKRRQQLRQDAEARKQAQGPDAEFHRAWELEAAVEDSFHDVDELLKRAAQEHTQAQALERVFGYYSALDDREAVAIDRRNESLKLLVQYRESLSSNAQQVPEDIIEAEYTVSNPLAPSSEAPVLTVGAVETSTFADEATIAAKAQVVPAEATTATEAVAAPAEGI